jgi:hypothetical protein
MLVNLMDQSVQRQGLDSGLWPKPRLAELAGLADRHDFDMCGRLSYQDPPGDGHEVDAAAITESDRIR